jgi:hypothetical protein
MASGMQGPDAMRTTTLAGVVVAGAVLAYRCGGISHQETEQAHGESPTHVPASPVHEGSDVRTQPRLGPSPGRLELRKPTPPQPGASVPFHHERAVQLVEDLERFRREYGISEERMQAILLTLYDFQEVHRYRTPRMIANPEWALETDQHARDAMHDVRRALREIMTREEYAAFHPRLLSSAFITLMLRQDLIAPQESQM